MSDQISKPAQEIAVGVFREILLWPLAAQSVAMVAGDGSSTTPLASLIQRIGHDQRWQPVSDLADHIGLSRLDEADAHETGNMRVKRRFYSEFLYFHHFVQRFLYGQASGGEVAETPLHLFRRTDIKAMRVRLQSGKALRKSSGAAWFEVELKVDRLNLYVFETGVSVLAIELCCRGAGAVLPVPDLAAEAVGSARDLTLAEAETMHDALRRVYPPFVTSEDGEYSVDHGLFPASVELLKEEAPTIPGTPPDLNRWIEAVWKDRTVPMAPWWVELISPLKATSPSSATATEDVIWCQIVDERIPTMLYLSVPDPLAISRGDMVRLCFADRAGSDAFPYAKRFLRNFERDNCYDRFWDDDAKTRFMTSGFAFIMLGPAGGNFETTFQEHFRRHYFQMGLILHFQSAALLMISGWLSQTIAKRGADGEGFHDRLAEIQDRVLSFTHRFWFSGVSNHLQGRELFDLWQLRLGTRVLYDEVMAECNSATEVLDRRAADRAADAGAILSLIAVLGVAIGLPFAFTGQNMFDATNPNVLWAKMWTVMTISLLAAACVAMAIARISLYPSWSWVETVERLFDCGPKGRIQTPRKRGIRRLVAWVFRLALGGSLVAALLAFYFWRV